MRLKHKPYAKEKMANHPEYVAHDAEQYKGKWDELFPTKQPIHIEVGSGRGRFITEMAKQNPDINYIAVEKYTSVAVDILEKALEAGVPNLKILNEDGQDLRDYFEDGEIDRVYLNFSDPWPKIRHAKRRLTHENFLARYEKLLKKDGEIHFKTDNQGLFEYSLMSFSRYGLEILDLSLDLHNSAFEGNIMTEYEQKFSSKGFRIYRVEAKFK
ncbi:MAG: tRNA (guanosine(46)-N7)-methyltransferase TrmB [Bacillaceae bacterium]